MFFCPDDSVVISGSDAVAAFSSLISAVSSISASFAASVSVMSTSSISAALLSVAEFEAEPEVLLEAEPGFLLMPCTSAGFAAFWLSAALASCV